MVKKTTTTKATKPKPVKVVTPKINQPHFTWMDPDRAYNSCDRFASMEQACKDAAKHYEGSPLLVYQAVAIVGEEGFAPPVTIISAN